MDCGIAERHGGNERSYRRGDELEADKVEESGDTARGDIQRKADEEGKERVKGDGAKNGGDRVLESGGRNDGARQRRDGVPVKVPLRYGRGRGRTVDARENPKCPEIHRNVVERERSRGRVKGPNPSSYKTVNTRHFKHSE